MLLWLTPKAFQNYGIVGNVFGQELKSNEAI